VSEISIRFRFLKSLLHGQVAELSDTVVALRDELLLKETTSVTEKRSLQTKIDNLERELTYLRQELAGVEAQLASAPRKDEVESMRRELRILKRLEYNQNDDDEDADRNQDPEISGTMASDPDLESVLVSKLLRAESDLVGERVSKTEWTEKCRMLERQIADLSQAKAQSDQLVAALEKDLERAISTPCRPGPNKKDENAALQRSNPLPVDAATALQSVLQSNTTQVTASLSHSSAVVATTGAQLPASMARTDDDHNVATIIMAQRDRLRARCDALEAERDSFKQELQVQVQAFESLKTDNTKLYEKVRYLQNYNKGAPVGRVTSKVSGGAIHSRSGLSVDRDIDLEALEQRYEASVDPFRQFNKAERQRKLQEMSPMERTVFVVAKTVLATKEMRTALFFYVLAMHMLVFITTYHWSHAESCNRIDHDHLAHMPPVLSAHLQEHVADLSTKQSETLSAP
jgi:homeobox protein cut-like